MIKFIIKNSIFIIIFLIFLSFIFVTMNYETIIKQLTQPKIESQSVLIQQPKIKSQPEIKEEQKQELQSEIQLEQQILSEQQQILSEQIKLLRQRRQKNLEPVDCVGYYEDVGDGNCIIDRCDPSNNIIGLGKKKQRFNITTQPKNLGAQCPEREIEVDCSQNAYSECVKCNMKNGGYYITGKCNVTKCLLNKDTDAGTSIGTDTGVGTKSHIWISPSLPVPLENCIMPQEDPLSCMINSFSNCNCTYTYDILPECNKNNTVCDNKNSSCSFNYTKTEPLENGICTTEFEYPLITINDGNCSCIVERTVGEWEYTNERCDPDNPTTFLATKRSRTITITKPEGGYEGCSFRPLENEIILETDRDKAFLNSNQEFQFRPEKSTFKTIQTETNIIFPDHPSCKCEGPDTSLNTSYTDWSEWNKTCPSRTDYTKSDSEFTISRTRTRTYNKTKAELMNGTCYQSNNEYTKQTEDNVLCPRDCSGNYSNVIAECKNTSGLSIDCSRNTTGYVPGVRIKTFDIFKSDLNSGEICEKDIPESCEKECPVNCVGYYEDIGNGTCIVNKCDPSNNTIGKGTKRQRFHTVIEPKHIGDICPVFEKDEECSVDDYPDCVKCNTTNGGRYVEGNCNITSCVSGTKIGQGKKSQTWTITDPPKPLKNCIMPKVDYEDCTFDNFSRCDCEYVNHNTPPVCNKINTVCDNKNSSCSYGITKILPLEGGICTPPLEYPKITTNDGVCNCIVNRSYGEWSNTNEECDRSNPRTLFVSNRSREITITKPEGGYNGCSFAPLENEVIIAADTDKGFVNSNQDFQFRLDKSTFKTIQTETNISFPNHTRCRCRGGATNLNASYSKWTDWNNTCPLHSDTSKSDDDFKISRTRTRTYISTKELNDGICPEEDLLYTKETQNNILCPRNCKGGAYQTNWSDCSNNGSTLICAASSIETQANKRGKQIKNWVGGINPIYGGAECPVQQIQDCSLNCAIDCSGGRWGPWYGCDARACLSASTETLSVIQGREKRDWIEGIEGINGGTSCVIAHPQQTQNCSRNCNIDCRGGIWSQYSECSSNGAILTCGATNIERQASKSGTKTRVWENGIRAGTGSACPIEAPQACTKECNIDCYGGNYETNWSDCSSNGSTLICGISSVETQAKKIGKQVKNWVGGIQSGTGTACAVQNRTQIQDCSLNCAIDCFGGTWSNWTGCTAPACIASNIETQSTKTGIEYKYLTGERVEINNGSCTRQQQQACTRSCPIDCTVTRLPDEWININPRCDPNPNNATTLIADKRTRTVTITKSGGSTSCTFPKLQNETILLDTVDNRGKGIMNGDRLQFGTSNTFKIEETENNAISLPNHARCRCRGGATNLDSSYEIWGQWDKTCPLSTDARPISDFRISRTRTRTYKKTNQDSLLANHSCPEAALDFTRFNETVSCPKDCSGGNLQQDWGVCTGTEYACGPASTERQPIRYGKQVKNWVDGTDASNNGITCASKKVERDCSQNCTIDCYDGTYDTNFSACSGISYACGPATTERQPIRYGKKVKNYRNGTEAVNNGITCAQKKIEEDCSQNCVINCYGNWNQWTPCSGTAYACGPASSERTRTRTGSRTRTYNGTVANNGLQCPAQQTETETCINNCPIDCTTGSWDAYTSCSAEACGPSSSERTPRKSGTKSRVWVNGNQANNGSACPVEELQTCTNECTIDCYGGSWGAGSGCNASCDNKSGEYAYGDENISFSGGTQPLNNGQACPTTATQNCSTWCPSNDSPSYDEPSYEDSCSCTYWQPWWGGGYWAQNCDCDGCPCDSDWGS